MKHLKVLSVLLFIYCAIVGKLYASEVFLVPEFGKTQAIILVTNHNFFLQNATNIEKREAVKKLISNNPDMQFIVFGTKGLEQKAANFLSPFSNTIYLKSEVEDMYAWARDWVPRILSNGYLINFFGGNDEEIPLLESLIAKSIY